MPVSYIIKSLDVKYCEILLREYLMEIDYDSVQCHPGVFIFFSGTKGTITRLVTTKMLQFTVIGGTNFRQQWRE